MTEVDGSKICCLHAKCLIFPGLKPGKGFYADSGGAVLHSGGRRLSVFGGIVSAAWANYFQITKYGDIFSVVYRNTAVVALAVFVLSTVFRYSAITLT